MKKKQKKANYKVHKEKKFPSDAMNAFMEMISYLGFHAAKGGYNDTMRKLELTYPAHCDMLWEDLQNNWSVSGVVAWGNAMERGFKKIDGWKEMETIQEQGKLF